jgi:primosomal protein N' (replication factor Y) (superfamily II helicase)
MSETARVVPLAPVEGTFTYRVPAELSDDVVAGARVLIPFGRRTITGVVSELTDEVGDVKDIVDVLDEAPAFSPVLLELTRWIAEYYVCTWGEAIKAALPAGTTVESRSVVRLLRHPTPDEPAAAGRVAALLDGNAMPLSTLVGDGITHHLVRRLAAAGIVSLEQELGGHGTAIRRATHLRLAEGVDPASLTPELRGARQRAILEALALSAASGDEEPSQADILARSGASTSSLKSLLEKGIVEVIEREVIRTPFDEVPAPAPDLALHTEQASALRAIEEAAGSGIHRAFLLHGITGSGKTEVYIQALRRVLARGQSGIVLVPEIALTPQTVRRFRAHFGDRIAVLHSRMSAGERFDAWRNLRSGRFRVAIGPRSAIFAPLTNVGLIVVDEEHEGSYKQFDPAPRYHARDVAVMRARLESAVCILGSATPSLETYLNAQADKYELLTMPVRVPLAGGSTAQLPSITVIDLVRERKIKRLKGALAHPLREAIAVRLEKGEGVILLQNRRGYSPLLICADCGHTPSCRDCAVSLTYHRSHRHLRCHYCGRVERLPATCPECESDALDRVGAGTQRVEEEISELFPRARLLRMDLDTTSRKDSHRKILDAFGRREADILLGTQMVAKGLDFAHVTLVGVVDADTGLLLPDFRSAERTFQLLTQVAGRAGRADQPGEVFLQTHRPQHPAVIAAAKHDYASFAEHELAERRLVGYPPYVRMAAVEFKGPDERAVEQAAKRWAGIARTQRQDIEVLGPEPAFVGRVKRQYRYHALLKAHRRVGPYELPALVRTVNEQHGPPRGGVRVNVDIDPTGVL